MVGAELAELLSAIYANNAVRLLNWPGTKLRIEFVATESKVKWFGKCTLMWRLLEKSIFRGGL